MSDQMIFVERDETVASEAVREATSKTHWLFLRSKVKYYKNREMSRKDIDEIFEEATSGQCYYASVETARFLAKSQPSLFSKMAILTTHDIPKTSPIYNNIEPGAYHSYFLLQSKDGFWYAGSPANHNMEIQNAISNSENRNKDSDYATTMFQGRKLEDVLAKIENRDRCFFPSAESVRKEFEKKDEGFKLDGEILEILHIKRAKDEVFSSFKRNR